MTKDKETETPMDDLKEEKKTDPEILPVKIKKKIGRPTNASLLQHEGKISKENAAEAIRALRNYIRACSQVVSVATKKTMKKLEDVSEFPPGPTNGAKRMYRRNRYAWKTAEDMTEEELFKQVAVLSKMTSLPGAAKTMLQAFQTQEALIAEKEAKGLEESTKKTLLEQILEAEVSPKSPAKTTEIMDETSEIQQIAQELNKVN